MKGVLIGITGKARSGKDTFAEMFAEEFYNATRKRFVMMAYAQELKLRVQRDFDLTYDQLWGDLKEAPDYRYPRTTDTYWTPREILQFIGTDCFRAVDNDFWINALFKTIDEKEYKHVIITDVRFPDEATPVIERDGYIIKVTSNRENIEQINNQKHISETLMDDFKHVNFHVKNDYSLDELRVITKTVVESIIATERLKQKKRGTIKWLKRKL